MAAPGPHQPHRAQSIWQRNALLQSFRRFRGEWTKRRDGRAMGQAQDEDQNGTNDLLLQGPSEVRDATRHRHRSQPAPRGSYREDGRPSDRPLPMRRRNSFSDAIKRLRQGWTHRTRDSAPKDSARVSCFRASGTLSEVPYGSTGQEGEGISPRSGQGNGVDSQSKQPKRHRRHSTGNQRRHDKCTSKDCPCHLVKAYTARIMEADRQQRLGRSLSQGHEGSSPKERIDWENVKLDEVKMLASPKSFCEPQHWSLEHNSEPRLKDRSEQEQLDCELGRQKARAVAELPSDKLPEDQVEQETQLSPGSLPAQAGLSESMNVPGNEDDRKGGSEPVVSLRALECPSHRDPIKHQRACTNPKCACSVVREFTKMTLKEEKCPSSGVSQDVEEHVLRTASSEASSSKNAAIQPKSKASIPRKSTRSSSSHGCTSPDCPCHVTRIHTQNLLNADRQQRQQKRENARRDAASQAVQPAPPTSRPAAAPQNLPVDKNTLRYLAKQYKLRKQPHRTKRVLMRKKEPQQPSRWQIAKYKSLVEFRDSMPDLLRSHLEEKEHQRQARKDLRYTRKKVVKKTVRDAVFSTSDYAMRRRAMVPYYHAYPPRDPPPIPTLMSKLPHPPPGYREASV